MLRLFRSTITVLLLTALSLGVSPHAQAAGSAHDVVIIMDTTSSMANEINQAKTDARATAQPFRGIPMPAWDLSSTRIGKAP